jgi:hypothetical protein
VSCLGWTFLDIEGEEKCGRISEIDGVGDGNRTRPTLELQQLSGSEWQHLVNPGSIGMSYWTADGPRGPAAIPRWPESKSGSDLKHSPLGQAGFVLRRTCCYREIIGMELRRFCVVCTSPIELKRILRGACTCSRGMRAKAQKRDQSI